MDHIVAFISPYLDIVTIVFLLVIVAAEVRPALWHPQWAERKLARQKARFLFFAWFSLRSFVIALGNERPNYMMLIVCGLLTCICVGLFLVKSKKAPNPIKITAYTFDKAAKEFRPTVLSEKCSITTETVRLSDGSSGYLFSAKQLDEEMPLTAAPLRKTGYELRRVEAVDIDARLDSTQTYYLFTQTPYAKHTGSFVITGFGAPSFSSHQLTICIEQKNNEAFATLVEYAYED